MQKRKLYYMLHSGKNSHVAYYLKNYLRQCAPAMVYKPSRCAQFRDSKREKKVSLLILKKYFEMTQKMLGL